MIFEYQDRGTLIHLLDPRTKTIWMVVVLLIATLLQQPPLLVLLFCITLIPILLVRIPARSLTMLATLYLIIGAGTILSQALFYRPSDGTLLSFIWLIPPDMPVIGTFTGGILVSIQGALHGFIQTFRILAVLNASAALVISTPLNRLIIGLRVMGMPGTFAFMLTTAVRFVPVLIEEYQIILSALHARNLISPYRPVRMIEQSFSPLIINVIRRCNQLALAADSRAFDMKRHRTAFSHIAFTRVDTTVFALTVCMILFFTFGSLQSAGSFT